MIESGNIYSYKGSTRGPLSPYHHVLPERYKILWDVTVNGRLCKSGIFNLIYRGFSWEGLQETRSGKVPLIIS
jgi:hypothetical protein